MSLLAIRVFSMQPALRDRCDRALATDIGLQVADTGTAQVGVFDVSDESLDLQLQAALRDCPAMHPLLLSHSSSRGDCANAIVLGAHGLLRYDEIEAKLTVATRHLGAGCLWFPVTAIPALLLLESMDAAARGCISLTRQEWKVATLASRGLANKEIAPILKVAESTVKWHLDNIFRKLGVHNRRDIAKAI